MQNTFMQVGNALTKIILRSPLQGTLSNNTLLIAFAGHKSGRKYSLPVNYVQDGDLLYITSSRDRRWWRNLRDGAPLTVRLHVRNIPAERIVIEEYISVMANLKRFFQIGPQFANYFNVRLDANGKPDEKDISQLAQERGMIKICFRSNW